MPCHLQLLLREQALYLVKTHQRGSSVDIIFSAHADIHLEIISQASFTFNPWNFCFFEKRSLGLGGRVCVCVFRATFIEF